LNDELQHASSAEVPDGEGWTDGDFADVEEPKRRKRESGSRLTTILWAILVVLLLATVASGYAAFSLFSGTRMPQTLAEQRIQDLRLQIDENPQEATLYLALATQYFDLEQYDKAGRVLDDLLSLNPQSMALAQALYGRARIDEMQGDENEALAGYLESLEVTETIDVRYALGSLYLERAQFDQAVENLQRSVELSPGDAGSLKQLARALEAQGDAVGALARWEEVRSYLPDDADAAAAIERLKGQQ